MEEREKFMLAAGLTTIGDSAFSGCTSLKSVTFQKTDGWCTEKIYDDDEPSHPIPSM